jgi:hypothetical protein
MFTRESAALTAYTFAPLRLGVGSGGTPGRPADGRMPFGQAASSRLTPMTANALTVACMLDFLRGHHDLDANP